jgi:hypothetical protein
MIAAPDAFPHLFPLNPKQTWPIPPERVSVIVSEAHYCNPSALSLLGTSSPAACHCTVSHLAARFCRYFAARRTERSAWCQV